MVYETLRTGTEFARYGVKVSFRSVRKVLKFRRCKAWLSCVQRKDILYFSDLLVMLAKIVRRRSCDKGAKE